jgi:hypothetical protein
VPTKSQWHIHLPLEVQSNFGAAPISRSSAVFKSFDDIVDHCCYAWNTLTDQPWKIMSIARRDWAAVGAKTIR